MAASVESQPGTPTAAVPRGMVANGAGKKPKTPIKPVTKSKGKKRSSCGIFWSPDNEHLRCRVTAGEDLATGGCTWRCPEPKVDGKTQCAKHIAYDENKKKWRLHSRHHERRILLPRHPVTLATATLVNHTVLTKPLPLDEQSTSAK